MEKWMIVYLLPLEVWMDIFVFPWITREEFGQIVDKIGNFKFTEHAQFYLHEWGRRTLNMDGKFFSKDGLCKYMNYKQVYLEIPQTPLPENIKFIDILEISHFDETTLDFLGKIRPLLTNLVLEFYATPHCLDNLRTALTHLAPFVDGIHALDCNDLTLPMAKQIFADKFANIKTLTISIDYGTEIQQQNVNTIMEWLAQSDDVGPRMCETHLHSNFTFCAQLLAAQFLAAKTPSTFFLASDRSEDFHAENSIGEVMDGVKMELNGIYLCCQVTRHPAGCNTEEVLEWIIENTKAKGCGRIKIYYPTIGQLDAAQVPAVDEKKEGQQQQPCSSKDV